MHSESQEPMKIVPSKVHGGDVGTRVDPEYSSYRVGLGDIERYWIGQRIGRGKYSEVFEGKDTGNVRGEDETSSRQSGSKIVIKTLKPVQLKKIKREILVLKTLSHPNIVSLRDVVYDRATDSYSLIFDYLKHKDTVELFKSIGLNSVRQYTRQMLEALSYAHSKGVIHRDIKPQNIIITTATKQVLIIDWGLAEFYRPKEKYSVRVSSRCYKAPELLVDYPYYDYSLDMWSFGCVLAEMLFKKFPFFCSDKMLPPIQEIVKVLGVDDLKKYIVKYEIPFDLSKLKQENGINIQELVPEGKEDDYKDAVDLLKKLLIYDPSERLTAEECLKHPFYTNK